MEAMDLLLMACHAQTLNLFVESFLKMVQKLLEDSDANLQIMATNSVKNYLSITRQSFIYFLILVCQVRQHRRRCSFVPSSLRLFYIKVLVDVSRKCRQLGAAKQY